ncbi:hypothetical protein ACFSE1_08030 [Rhizobium helianthi]|uniref:Uncharacterized protein n=1 Tax=Rhizobium helianthi TaxID=1132695 RepID=A0ABW4M1V1_9HYPH
MANGSDPYGSTEETTEYKGTRRGSGRGKPSGSLAAVVMAAAFLVLAVGAFLFWPQSPGGDGSPGEAVILQKPGTGPSTQDR